jgi:hypothetical protein
LGERQALERRMLMRATALRHLPVRARGVGAGRRGGRGGWWSDRRGNGAVWPLQGQNGDKRDKQGHDSAEPQGPRPAPPDLV